MAIKTVVTQDLQGDWWTCYPVPPSILFAAKAASAHEMALKAAEKRILDCCSANGGVQSIFYGSTDYIPMSYRFQTAEDELGFWTGTPVRFDPKWLSDRGLSV